LVGRDQRDRSFAQGELRQDGERLGARRDTDDPELGAVLLAQVACDRLRDDRVVVHRQDRRLRHPVRSPDCCPRQD